MYSGYVNVTREDFLFYWLAEASPGVPHDAPLIVWTGGGPGCSAMEGAALETGPYVLWDIKTGSSMFNRRLVKNSWSWTRMAHVLYVDQPRYVGFSYGTGPMMTSSVDAAVDMVMFLRGWRTIFPEHAWRPLIFASDSYGGHLVGAWADAVLDFNRNAYRIGEEPLPLRGIALGNALLDERFQGLDTRHDYQRLHGLIAEDAPMARTEAESRRQMEQHLGYLPNVYDYRLREQECCGCAAYNYKAWADWMTMKSVTDALHVCGNAGTAGFGGCSAGCVALPGFDQAHPPNTLKALGRALNEGVAVTLYYGMQDVAVNHIGGLAAANAIAWQGAADFRSKGLEPFEFAGAVAGQTKTVGGLTWMQVEGAGHMVTMDQPGAAAFAMRGLIQVAMGQEEASAHVRYT